MKGTLMKFNDSQQMRICEIAESIFWESVTASGGLLVEDAADLEIINTRVYEQGRALLRYLEDISLDPELNVKIEEANNKIIKKGNK